MKIQTPALIESLILDDIPQDLQREQEHYIQLEFSAIDTGGAFRDPILDFSILLQNVDLGHPSTGKKHNIDLSLTDPAKKDNKIRFSCTCELAINDEQLEINGRLHEDEINNELVGFVLKRFQ